MDRVCLVHADAETRTAAHLNISITPWMRQWRTLCRPGGVQGVERLTLVLSMSLPAKPILGKLTTMLPLCRHPREGGDLVNAGVCDWSAALRRTGSPPSRG